MGEIFSPFNITNLSHNRSFICEPLIDFHTWAWEACCYVITACTVELGYVFFCWKTIYVDTYLSWVLPLGRVAMCYGGIENWCPDLPNVDVMWCLMSSRRSQVGVLLYALTEPQCRYKLHLVLIWSNHFILREIKSQNWPWGINESSASSALTRGWRDQKASRGGEQIICSMDRCNTR